MAPKLDRCLLCGRRKKIVFESLKTLRERTFGLKQVLMNFFPPFCSITRCEATWISSIPVHECTYFIRSYVWCTCVYYVRLGFWLCNRCYCICKLSSVFMVSRGSLSGLFLVARDWNTVVFTAVLGSDKNEEENSYCFFRTKNLLYRYRYPGIRYDPNKMVLTALQASLIFAPSKVPFPR